ncbi:hypothetical protein AAFP35_17485 [Gordonia sp. CPCC 206044]|uniref:WXG100-like domain-containing protein n=1 Tax=Gordonia sp. CPCC 206044 TaxID=3140793 RepID=UPI003AF35CD7
MEWPEGDEDSLRRIGAAWDDAASAVESLRPALVAAAGVVRQNMSGATNDALTAAFNELLDGEQSPDKIAAAARHAANMSNSTATDVEYTKISFYVMMAVTAAQIAWALAMAPATAGASMATAVAAEELGKLAARLGLQQLVERIAAVVGNGLVLGAVKGAMTNAAIASMQSAGIQAYQIAAGGRKGFDSERFLKDVSTQAVGGAAGGAAGQVVESGVSKALGRSVDDLGAGKRVGVSMAAGAVNGGTSATASGVYANQKYGDPFNPKTILGGMAAGAASSGSGRRGASTRDDAAPATGRAGDADHSSTSETGGAGPTQSPPSPSDDASVRSATPSSATSADSPGGPQVGQQSSAASVSPSTEGGSGPMDAPTSATDAPTTSPGGGEEPPAAGDRSLAEYPTPSSSTEQGRSDSSSPGESSDSADTTQDSPERAQDAGSAASGEQSHSLDADPVDSGSVQPSSDSTNAPGDHNDSGAITEPAAEPEQSPSTTPRGEPSTSTPDRNADSDARSPETHSDDVDSGNGRGAAPQVEDTYTAVAGEGSNSTASEELESAKADAHEGDSSIADRAPAASVPVTEPDSGRGSESPQPDATTDERSTAGAEGSSTDQAATVPGADTADETAGEPTATSGERADAETPSTAADSPTTENGEGTEAADGSDLPGQSGESTDTADTADPSDLLDESGEGADGVDTTDWPGESGEATDTTDPSDPTKSESADGLPDHDESESSGDSPDPESDAPSEGSSGDDSDDETSGTDSDESVPPATPDDSPPAPDTNPPPQPSAAQSDPDAPEPDHPGSPHPEPSEPEPRPDESPAPDASAEAGVPSAQDSAGGPVAEAPGSDDPGSFEAPTVSEPGPAAHDPGATVPQSAGQSTQASVTAATTPMSAGQPITVTPAATAPLSTAQVSMGGGLTVDAPAAAPPHAVTPGATTAPPAQAHISPPPHAMRPDSLGGDGGSSTQRTPDVDSRSTPRADGGMRNDAPHRAEPAVRHDAPGRADPALRRPVGPESGSRIGDSTDAQPILERPVPTPPPTPPTVDIPKVPELHPHDGPPDPLAPRDAPAEELPPPRGGDTPPKPDSPETPPGSDEGTGRHGSDEHVTDPEPRDTQDTDEPGGRPDSLPGHAVGNLSESLGRGLEVDGADGPSLDVPDDQALLGGDAATNADATGLLLLNHHAAWSDGSQIGRETTQTRARLDAARDARIRAVRDANGADPVHEELTEDAAAEFSADHPDGRGLDQPTHIANGPIFIGAPTPPAVPPHHTVEDRANTSGSDAIAVFDEHYAWERLSSPDDTSGLDGMTVRELQEAAGGEFRSTCAVSLRESLTLLGDRSGALLVLATEGGADVKAVLNRNGALVAVSGPSGERVERSLPGAFDQRAWAITFGPDGSPTDS